MKLRRQFGAAGSGTVQSADGDSTVQVALDMSATNRASQALLVFANPADVDCERRKWPLSFRQLFQTGRFSDLAVSNIDVHLFTSASPLSSKDSRCTVHVQRGARRSFGARLESAVECLVGLGYSRIVVVGSDCPSLTQAEILTAFELLDHKRLVAGPDHRGGCYLIGLHAGDRPDFSQIHWHTNTDFAQLLRLYRDGDTAQLEQKIDLDTLEDLRLLARLNGPDGALARALLSALALRNCADASSPRSTASRHLTLSWQLPPPALAFA